MKITMYVRLISYSEACDLVKYMESIEAAGFITVGGVEVIGTKEQLDKLSVWAEKNCFRFELCSEHPEKVRQNIITDLRSKGVIK